MLDLYRHIAIASPPAVVWPIMADVVRWHEWTASITRIEALDGEALQVGRRYRVHQPKLPPALWRVTEVLPDQGFVWISTAPGVSIEARHRISSAGSECRVELGIRYGGWLGVLVGLVFRGISHRYVTMEAEGLKKRAEGRT